MIGRNVLSAGPNPDFTSLADLLGSLLETIYAPSLVYFSCWYKTKAPSLFVQNVSLPTSLPRHMDWSAAGQQMPRECAN